MGAVPPGFHLPGMGVEPSGSPWGEARTAAEWVSEREQGPVQVQEQVQERPILRVRVQAANPGSSQGARVPARAPHNRESPPQQAQVRAPA